jgi:CheY-like chemotaxis protein
MEDVMKAPEERLIKQAREGTRIAALLETVASDFRRHSRHTPPYLIVPLLAAEEYRVPLPEAVLARVLKSAFALCYAFARFDFPLLISLSERASFWRLRLQIHWNGAPVPLLSAFDPDGSTELPDEATSEEIERHLLLGALLRATYQAGVVADLRVDEHTGVSIVLEGTGNSTEFTANGVPRTVLLIQHVRPVAELASYYLRQAGYRVVMAEGAASGVRLAEALKPDLVLVDVLQPEQDGFAIMETLHELPRTWNLPVLMLSPFPCEDECISAGAAGQLTLPLQRAPLLRHVAEILRAAPVSRTTSTDFSRACTLAIGDADLGLGNLPEPLRGTVRVMDGFDPTELRAALLTTDGQRAVAVLSDVFQARLAALALQLVPAPLRMPVLAVAQPEAFAAAAFWLDGLVDELIVPDVWRARTTAG